MTGTEQIATLRISLAEITPEIWRRVEVPVGMSLKGLHDVIQAVFGWQDYHLHELRVGGKIYGIVDEESGDTRDDRRIKLGAVLDRGIDRFEYAYDFGDDWLHLIAVEAVADGEPGVEYPRFVDGARRGPPEDCGGPWGYGDFVEAIDNPRHPEHRQMLEWYGGPYDPDDLGLVEIQRRLQKIAERRLAGKAGYARSVALKR